MRTLIAGGGTGGHLTPALAVAQALRAADPAGEVMLVGRRGGIEETLVPPTGFPLALLDVRGVDTSRPLTAATALLRLPLAVVEARRIIRRFSPDVVVGAAGYVCVPAVLAARTARLPIVLMEQNAVPGRAVRALSRLAEVVAASFADTASHLPGVRVVHTGNPVRAEVTAAAPAPLRERCAAVLVMGGSQGARRINEAVWACAGGLLADHPGLRVVHQCGSRDADRGAAAAAALPGAVCDRYTVAPFFDDVAARIADADLVVMRAGGSSLAEVSALGRPMVLVPYPYAGAHQAANAAPYQRAGAAVVVDDAACDGPRLRAEIERFLTDAGRWREMALSSAAAGRPDAARRVADLVAQAAAGR